LTQAEFRELQSNDGLGTFGHNVGRSILNLGTAAVQIVGSAAGSVQRLWYLDRIGDLYRGDALLEGGLTGLSTPFPAGRLAAAVRVARLEAGAGVPLPRMWLKHVGAVGDLKLLRATPELAGGRLEYKDVSIGAFGGLVARTPEEALFLRNAETTFGKDSVFSSAIRFGDNIVIQRSDISFSVQNVRRMAAGNSPFARNASGQWEKVNLHHIGRQDGKVIEILSSHNAYNPTTGGPLHIPGPGGPPRNLDVQQYWQQRLQNAVGDGLVPESILRRAGVAD
jgi:hypothetical protein